jgi:hypothetical protein
MPAMPIEPAAPVCCTSSTWSPLYRVGAVSALVMVILMLVQMVFFIIAPPPSFLPSHAAALDWFALFQSRPYLALVHLDGFLLVDYLFVLMVFLALWVALRPARPVSTLIALVLCMVGTAVYFASNPAFTLMSLADQYAIATRDVERMQLVAAAQSTLAVYHGTPFDVAYVLSAISGLLMCSAMIGTGVFGRPTASFGIAAYALSIVPATAGMLGLVLSIASLVPLAIWLLLVARRLRTLR